MKLARMLAIVGIAFGLSTALVSAQSPTAAPAKDSTQASPDVDPKAKEFIDAYRDASSKLLDISCSVSQTMDNGESKDTHTGDYMATLVRRGKSTSGPASPKMYRITVKDSENDTTFAYDGGTVYRIDNKDRTFAKADAADGASAPAEAAQLFPNWARGADVLSNPNAKLTAARFLPDTELDGVKCRVVQYTVVTETKIPSEDHDDSKSTTMTTTVTQTRAVGADDLLTRKIESRVTYKNAPEEIPSSTFTGVYKNVKVNTKPDAAAFALKQPGGYKVVEADPEDLGVAGGQPKLKFAVGQAAPDFTLKSADGSEVSLASLKGRVVLLDFWATWCGPCKMAMPGVQKLSEKYKGKQVSVFGVDTFERGGEAKAAEKAKKYMDDQKYTYGLLYNGDALAKQYGISGIPTFILIGPDGKILHIGVGYEPDNEDKLAEKIDKALNSKS